MNKQCHQVQEKIACAINFDLKDQKHIVECLKCQNVFADYQTLTLLLDEDMEKVEVPDHFSDRVMVSIEQLQNESDWYENFIQKMNRFLDKPLIHYASIATGFGVGVIAFIRFVAFVFIPA